MYVNKQSNPISMQRWWHRILIQTKKHFLSKHSDLVQTASRTTDVLISTTLHRIEQQPARIHVFPTVDSSLCFHNGHRRAHALL